MTKLFSLLLYTKFSLKHFFCYDFQSKDFEVKLAYNKKNSTVECVKFSMRNMHYLLNQTSEGIIKGRSRWINSSVLLKREHVLIIYVKHLQFGKTPPKTSLFCTFISRKFWFGCQNLERYSRKDPTKLSLTRYRESSN